MGSKINPIEQAFIDMLHVSTELQMHAAVKSAPSLAQCKEMGNKLDKARTLVQSCMNNARRVLEQGK